jgi:hypothetical protein
MLQTIISQAVYVSRLRCNPYSLIVEKLFQRMNHSLQRPRFGKMFSRWFAPFILALLGLGFFPHCSQAAANVNISIWHGYGFYYPQIGISGTPAPVTFHWLENADGTFWRQVGGTNGNSGYSGSSLDTALTTVTNGLWKLYFNRGDVSEEVFYFKVTITGVTPAVLTPVVVTHPLNGSIGVENNPTYTWTGPTGWQGILATVFTENFSTVYNDDLPGAVTSWTPGPLSSGGHEFLVIYYTNNYPGISMTTPTNSSGTPLAGWMGQGNLNTYRYSSFEVTGTGGSGGHTLAARYAFENGNIFAFDYSGNGNNVATISSSSGGTRFVTNNPALGNFSAHFNNNNGAGAGWLNGPEALLETLAGSFTVSLWVQTTQTSGLDTDSGLFGNAGLVTAFTGPGGNWVVPMALVGNKLAFATGGSPQHTLRSTVAITNASEFVHLAVTRNQFTGEKKIYVNGVLNATGAGATGLLDTPTSLDIGYNNGTGLQGTMDEIQFYAGVLSDEKVLFLYNNPGSTVPNEGGGGDPDLAEAVDAPYLVWTTGGDANWFSQTEETNGGEDAAQSGAIGDGEESWIETKVVGPGFLYFYWNVSSEDQDGYDYLEFSVNGITETEISGDWGWDYFDLFLDEGIHTLRWTYHKDGEFTAGQDAAWLDEVYYSQEVEMDITLVIERNNDPLNPGFLCYPSINSYYPDPITSYDVVAPGNWSSSYVDQDDNESSPGWFTTLGDMITALESGDWTVYVNRNHPQERVFKFSVSAADLDLSDLPAVNFTSPTEGQTGIATNHVFTWTGPNDFNGLFLSSYAVPFAPSGGFINLTATLKSTRMPSALVEGTNNIFINYGRYDVADVEISYPEDDFGTSFYSWSAQTDLQLTQNRKFVVGAQLPPAIPVEILNPQSSGGNLGFSFFTQAGRTHTIQSRTNLTTAPWLNRTNFVGDGQVWQFNFPIGLAPESYFRVETQ